VLEQIGDAVGESANDPPPGNIVTPHVDAAGSNITLAACRVRRLVRTLFLTPPCDATNGSRYRPVEHINDMLPSVLCLERPSKRTGRNV
jgi:hypothetical protein